jgi:type IV pilus assembly protein PilC
MLERQTMSRSPESQSYFNKHFPLGINEKSRKVTGDLSQRALQTPQPSKLCKPLNLKELILFTRTLSTTMQAGLPILRALNLAAHHLPASSRSIITSLLSAVENGTPLANALRRYPDSFDPLFVSMVKIGERSGTLAESLSHLTTTLESKQALRTATLTALLYPILVGSITLLVTLVLLVCVVPAFRELFAEYGIALPFLTEVILSISDTLLTYWYLFAGGCAVLLLSFGKILRSPQGTILIKERLERLPVLGTLLRTATIVRITKALGTMISAGIPAAESLAVCAESCAPPPLRNQLLVAARSIQEGNPLAQSLAATTNLPPLMIEMIRIGEESGTLDSALTISSRWYEDELHSKTKRLSQLVEPLLMLFLGIVVGGIVLAMYLPIFEMGNVISR